MPCMPHKSCREHDILSIKSSFIFKQVLLCILWMLFDQVTKRTLPKHRPPWRFSICEDNRAQGVSSRAARKWASHKTVPRIGKPFVTHPIEPYDWQTDDTSEECTLNKSSAKYLGPPLRRGGGGRSNPGSKTAPPAGPWGRGTLGAGTLNETWQYHRYWLQIVLYLFSNIFLLCWKINFYHKI